MVTMFSDPTDIRMLDKFDKNAPSQPTASRRAVCPRWIKCARVPVLEGVSNAKCSRIAIWNAYRSEAGQVVSSTSFPGHSLADEIVVLGQTTALAAPLKGATRTNPIVASICSSCLIPCLSCGDQGGRFSGEWDKLARDVCPAGLQYIIWRK